MTIIKSKIHGAKREVGFTETSPGVWEKSLPQDTVIVSVEVNANQVGWTFIEGVLSVTSTENPNSHFTNVIREFHFANAPINALASNGRTVYYEPLLKSVSAFGTELDLNNQNFIAVETSTTLQFIQNDWWLTNFDAYTFENQKVYLLQDEVVKFQGKIESKTFGPTISLKCKDLMADLKGSFVLPTMKSLGFTQVELSDDETLARTIYGRVAGFVPVNVDNRRQGLYPLPGDVSLTFGSSTVGASFNCFTYLSVGDEISVTVDGLPEPIQLTIGTIPTDSYFTLTEAWSEAPYSGEAYLKPQAPKRWMNRVFKVANHALREPQTTTVSGSTTSLLFVHSTRDIQDGDTLLIGGTINVIVSKVVNETTLRLATSLVNAPSAGTTVKRYAIQDVRIDGVLLQPTRDYSVDALNAELTLELNAEANAGSTYESTETGVFTSGSKTVLGTGTSFKSWATPGMLIRGKGKTQFFEVMDVVSDTEITLRENATYSHSVGVLQFKDLLYWNDSILTCEVLGRTDDGTTSGILLETPDKIVQDVLALAQVHENDLGEFEECSQKLSFCIPSKVSDKTVPTFRSVINQINQSALTMLYTNEAFKFGFRRVKPRADVNRLRLKDTDILSITYSQNASKIQGEIKVSYAREEYNSLLRNEKKSFVATSSNQAAFVLKTLKVFELESLLAEESAATILANRLAYLFDKAQTEVEIEFQSSDSISIGDIIEIEHSKLPPKFGSKRTLVLVQGVKRSLDGFVRLSAIDLSGAFLSSCFITENSAKSYQNTSNNNRMSQGFIKDGHLIDDDETTLNRYLIF